MPADPNKPIAFLTGSFVDISCTPGSDGGVRFPTHGGFVGQVVHVLTSLKKSRLLLEADVRGMRQEAAHSDVGPPDSCGP